MITTPLDNVDIKKLFFFLDTLPNSILLIVLWEFPIVTSFEKVGSKWET